MGQSVLPRQEHTLQVASSACYIPSETGNLLQIHYIHSISSARPETTDTI